MIDCMQCGKQIGSMKEPIFVAKDEESIVCRECCTTLDGAAPSAGREEYDPEELSQEELKQLDENKEDN